MVLGAERREQLLLERRLDRPPHTGAQRRLNILPKLENRTWGCATVLHGVSLHRRYRGELLFASAGGYAIFNFYKTRDGSRACSPHRTERRRHRCREGEPAHRDSGCTPHGESVPWAELRSRRFLGNRRQHQD
jgi:hypothetical protein